LDEKGMEVLKGRLLGFSGRSPLKTVQKYLEKRRECIRKGLDEGRE